MPYRTTPTKWTTELFAKRIGEISPSIHVIGEYKNTSEKIECICLKCGNKWFPNSGNLLKGCGCPECAKENQSKRMKENRPIRQLWTQNTFAEKMEEIDSTIEILGKYINTATKIDCRCKQCGEMWSPIANNLLRGKSHCPKCSKRNATTQTSMTHDEFIKRVSEKNPSVAVIGHYETTKAKILCRCKKCENEWMATGDSLLSGRGCRKCAYSQNKENMRLTQEEFTNKLKYVNNNIIALDEYSGSYVPITFKCLICGNEWKTKPHYVLVGNGCPECVHVSTSYVEQFLLIAFRHVLGETEVLSRDKSKIGKELDIYLPSYNLAIEPGAWAFHKTKRKADELKIKLCEDQGIKLIVVYTGYEGKPLENTNYYCYSKNLSRKSEQKMLIELFYQILKSIGIQEQLADDKWEEISSLAYLKSRRMTTEEFINRLSKINPTVSVLGEFKGNGIKLSCKCNECNNEWNVTPGDLLSGKGCPSCAIKRVSDYRRYSQEDYVSLVAERNPKVEVLGTYLGSNKKIKCRCKKCGYMWTPVAGSIIGTKVHGCPNCAGKTRDTNSFVELMRGINPNIEILGTYVSTDTGITCRCRLCEKVWIPKPHSLLAGHGCPICSRKKKGES